MPIFTVSRSQNRCRKYTKIYAHYNGSHRHHVKHDSYLSAHFSKTSKSTMDDATPLIFPQLGPIYQALFPWAEMLLRAAVGLTLVPHGLRSAFGMFPSTGGQSHNMTEFGKMSGV